MAIVSHKPAKPRLDAHWTIYCDGSTYQSNPSSMGGWGFAVYADSRLYYAAHGELSGVVTNNLAEFKAVFFALRWCHLRGLHDPYIYSDSAQVVSLLKGDAQPKQDNVKLSYAACKHYELFLTPHYDNVPRTHELQRFSDFLANLGLHGGGEYKQLAQHTLLLEAYAKWNPAT